MPIWNIVVEEVIEEMIKAHEESLSLNLNSINAKYSFTFNMVVKKKIYIFDSQI